MPLLGVMDLVTRRVGLDDAPAMYEKFQKKEDGCINAVLQPWPASRWRENFFQAFRNDLPGHGPED